MNRTGWLLLLSFAACGDDPDFDVPPPTQSDESPVTPPDDVVASCDQAPGGTPCGLPGGDMHCIFNVCVENACGDGYKAGDEECDDGDEVDGNGCSAHCTDEVCGNGIVDVGEECDEGAAKRNGSCDAQCRKADASADLDGGAPEAGEPPDPDCPPSGELTIASDKGYGDGPTIEVSGPEFEGVEYLWWVENACGRNNGTVLGVRMFFQCKGNETRVCAMRRLSTKAGCEPALHEAQIHCIAIDDAGTLDSGTGALDSGASMDAQTPDATLPDAAAPDAGPDAAAPPDAGVALDTGVPPDTGSADVWATCRQCLDSVCSSDPNEGVELGPQCFQGSATGIFGDLPQPEATEACTAAVRCSVVAADGCANEDPVACYCGDQDQATCLSNGPGRGAPCVAEWERATTCLAQFPGADSASLASRNQCVAGAFGDLTFASGYAFYSLRCAQANCRTACALEQ